MNDTKTKLAKKRILLVIGGLLLLAVSGCALLIYLGFPSVDDRCINDNVAMTVSPNGKLKAVTFRRNCGATTSYSTGVSVFAASDNLPNAAGNVFVANREPWITVHWVDDRHLSISGATQTQFLRLTEFRGIRVTYD